MKKLIALSLSIALFGSFAAMAQPTAADQKWLEVAQKLFIKGETRVSTPSQERVLLLKEWATKKGISLVVTKTDLGYRLELSKSVVQR